LNIAGKGSSSETTNGVIVKASKKKVYGITRPQALVGIYASSYLPYKDSGYADTSYANDTGAFAFLDIPEGYYDLFIHDIKSKKALFVVSINAAIDQESTIKIDTIKSMGSLQGNVKTISKTINQKQVSAVYIKGAPFFTGVDTGSGDFLLKNIPVGEYYITVCIKATGIDTIDNKMNILHPKPVLIFPDSTSTVSRK
jgi:hypothetical protein